MARKASEADLGQAITPSVNGDGHSPSLRPEPEAAGPHVNSPFPPIAEYAFLSDCEVNALVAPDHAPVRVLEKLCGRPLSPSR